MLCLGLEIYNSFIHKALFFSENVEKLQKKAKIMLKS